MFSRKIQVLSETIKKLLSCNAEENLKIILSKTHEADIAYLLATCDPEQQVHIFSLLGDYQKKALVLSELQQDCVTPLLKTLGAKEAANILENVSPDDAVDIVEKLPNDLASEILLLLKKEEALEVEGLIRYRSDTAGGIMSPKVFALREDLTVSQAIRKIQHAKEMEGVFYVYVVNSQNHLVGVLSLKKLILSPPQATLESVMEKDPVRVRLNEDQEEVARTVSRYNYLSLPVVNDANKLVGVITVDDVIDVIKEEATEDMLLIAGVDKEAVEKSSFWGGLRKRLPWFFVTLLGGVIAAEIIAAFFIPKTPLGIFALFIPLLLGMGTSIGIQSMTVFVSILSVEGAGFSQIGPVMFKEFRLSLIIGLSYGLLTALFIHYRWDMGALPFVVGSTLVMTMILAVLIGIFTPFLFQRIGFDPAIATGSIVTTLVSIFVIWAYVFLAKYFMKAVLPL